MNRSHFFVVIGVLLILIGGYSFVHRAPLETRIVDESAHVSQVQRILKGDPERYESLTTLLGYHYITAGGFLVFDYFLDFEKPKTYHMRMMAVLYTVLLFVSLTYLLYSLREPREKAFIVLALPVLAPYLFIAYTEVLSLIFVMLALLLCWRKWYLLSGLAIFVALLIRQDNIIWVGLLILLSTLRQIDHLRFSKEVLLRSAKTNMSYLLGVCAFCIFLLSNGTIAVGDADAHPISLHDENIFFFLILVSLIFLPTIISYRTDMVRILQHYAFRSLCVALTASSVYLLSFDLVHSYNRNMRFLHNYLGNFFTEHKLGVVLGIVLVLIGILFLAAIARTSEKHRLTLVLVYLCAAASLVLHPLMEHRYTIIPMVLIIIFLAFKSMGWLYTQFVYMLGLSALYYIIVFMLDLFK